MKTRTCPHCTEVFQTNHSFKRFCSPPCQEQANRAAAWEKVKTNHAHRCRKLAQMAKNRAKTGKLDFNLDGEYLTALWETQRGRCCISGREFDLSRPTDTTVIANAPSLDRIIPSKGYTKGNVRLVCYQVNTALNEYGLDALLALCEDILGMQPQKKRG